jgi:hypothetical protein
MLVGTPAPEFAAIGVPTNAIKLRLEVAGEGTCNGHLSGYGVPTIAVNLSKIVCCNLLKLRRYAGRRFMSPSGGGKGEEYAICYD